MPCKILRVHESWIKFSSYLAKNETKAVLTTARDDQIFCCDIPDVSWNNSKEELESSDLIEKEKRNEQEQSDESDATQSDSQTIEEYAFPYASVQTLQADTFVSDMKDSDAWRFFAGSISRQEAENILRSICIIEMHTKLT